MRPALADRGPLLNRIAFAQEVRRRWTFSGESSKLRRTMKVTYYLEVISSWCYWAEPAWAELKQRYRGKVEFGWKIALMPSEVYPASQTQCQWFYRRSGAIMRSPFLLNSGWFEPEIKQYLAPNFVAEAAKDFNVADDCVRLAIANAALREGRKVGRWEEAAAVATW